MTEPTPTDEIRAAAEKLRTLATAASTDTDGTPTAHWSCSPRWREEEVRRPTADMPHFLYGDYLTRDDGKVISWPKILRGGTQQRPSQMDRAHAQYAAAMDPTVGLALADLLDDLADGDDEGETNPWAFALARAINGESA